VGWKVPLRLPRIVDGELGSNPSNNPIPLAWLGARVPDGRRVLAKWCSLDFPDPAG
jgi:hypothetical protein